MKQECWLLCSILITFVNRLVASSSYLYYPLNAQSTTATTPFNQHIKPSTCNSIIDQPVQWLLCPNYPSPYDESSSCRYFLNKYSIDVCRVELTFPDFNIEYSVNCLNDYFLLNNGIRLCGTLAPDAKYIIEFTQQSHQLELNFVSNSDINKSGFVAIFSQLNNSCNPLTNLQYDRRTIGGSDYADHHYQVGYHPLPPTLNHDNVDCDQKIFSFEGTLKSPHFPSFYPINRLCRYLFKRPIDQVCKVKFKIKTFDLNNYPSKQDRMNCDNGDYLELVNSQNRLCGYKLQETFILEYKEKSNFLPVCFYSDSTGVSTGFDIEFEQLENSCIGKDLLIATKCDLKLKNENRLTSPNYPQNYDSNSVCIYEIEPINSNYCGFTLQFRAFNLEQSVDQMGRCNKDYLEMPDGERVCGTNKPLEKLFTFKTEQKQYFMFASDGQHQESGFDIEINQIACQAPINRSNRINNKMPQDFSRSYDEYDSHSTRCDQLITSKHQIIVSPNYPHHYPSSNCQYSIYKYSESVCQVRIQFLDFDLKSSNQCQNDYLIIMNTGERFCGKEMHLANKAEGSSHSCSPYCLIVIDFQNSDAIRLRFISHTKHGGVGFKLSIEQLENSCRDSRTFNYFNANTNTALQPSSGHLKVCGVFNQEQFSIESPNYPLTYPAQVHCRICKANRNVHALDIFFSDFSVGTVEKNFCPNDYLEINGERYCGVLKNQHLIINFPANLNIINFRFRTDERDHYLGFKLSIKQISTNRTSMIRSNFNILGLNTTSLSYSGDYHRPNSISQASPNSFKNFNPPSSLYNQNDLYYYNHNLINQLSSANDINCLPKFFNQKSFYLTSPGYRDKNYPCSMQCNYWIRKANSNVCAIQLVFDEFRVETSTQCAKDNLQIKNLKFCGTIPMQTKKTLEFSENQIVITFKTDPSKTDIGFHITIEQIEC